MCDEIMLENLILLIDNVKKIPIFSQKRKDYVFPTITLLSIVGDAQFSKQFSKLRKKKQNHPKLYDSLDSILGKHKTFLSDILTVGSDEFAKIQLVEILQHFQKSRYYHTFKSELKTGDIVKDDSIIEKQYKSYLDNMQSLNTRVILKSNLHVTWQLALQSKNYKLYYNVNGLGAIYLLPLYLSNMKKYAHNMDTLDVQRVCNKIYGNIDEFCLLVNLERLFKEYGDVFVSFDEHALRHLIEQHVGISRNANIDFSALVDLHFDQIKKLISNFVSCEIDDVDIFKRYINANRIMYQLRQLNTLTANETCKWDDILQEYTRYASLARTEKLFLKMLLSTSGGGVHAKKEYRSIEMDIRDFYLSNDEFQKYCSLNGIEKLQYASDLFCVKLFILDVKDNHQTPTLNATHSNSPFSMYLFENHLVSLQDKVVFCNFTLKYDTQKLLPPRGKPDFIPEYTDSLNYYIKCGNLVPGITKTFEGLLVYNKTFKDEFYQIDENNPNSGNEGPKRQFKDAFEFLRKGPPHLRNRYSLRHLLARMDFYAIFSLIIENEHKHSFYENGIYPLIDYYKDNQKNLRQINLLTNRYADSITGYENSNFDNVFNVSDIYDKDIDKVTDQVLGYKMRIVKIMSKEYIYSHRLSPKNVLLVLATIHSNRKGSSALLDSTLLSVSEQQFQKYSNCYCNIQDLFDEIRDVMENYNQTQKHKGRNSELYFQERILDLLFDYLLECFLQNGPLVFSKAKVQTQFENPNNSMQVDWILFEQLLKVHYRWCIKEIVNEEDLKSILKSILLNGTIMGSTLFFHEAIQIKKQSWYQFLGKLRESHLQKIREKVGRFQTPCYVKIENPYHIFYRQIGKLQSYSIRKDIWKVIIDKNNIIDLKFNEFTILYNERCLPAKVKFLQSVHAVQVHNRNQLCQVKHNPSLPMIKNYIEYGTAIGKIGKNYVVSVPDHHQTFTLVRNVHFVWAEPIYMTTDHFKEKLLRNNVGIDIKLVQEEPFDDKGNRIYVYNALYEDAIAPTKDERMWKPLIYDFFHHDLYNIKKFLDFLEIKMSNKQIYFLHSQLGNADYTRNNLVECNTQRNTQPQFVDPVISNLIKAVATIWIQIGYQIVYFKYDKSRFHDVIAAIFAKSKMDTLDSLVDNDCILLWALLKTIYPFKNRKDIKTLCFDVVKILKNYHRVDNDKQVSIFTHATVNNILDGDINIYRVKPITSKIAKSVTTKGDSVEKRKRENRPTSHMHNAIHTKKSDTNDGNRTSMNTAPLFKTDLLKNIVAKFFTDISTTLKNDGSPVLHDNEKKWLYMFIDMFWRDDYMKDMYKFRDSIKLHIQNLGLYFTKMGSYQCVRMYRFLKFNLKSVSKSETEPLCDDNITFKNHEKILSNDTLFLQFANTIGIAEKHQDVVEYLMEQYDEMWEYDQSFRALHIQYALVKYFQSFIKLSENPKATTFFLIYFIFRFMISENFEAFK